MKAETKFDPQQVLWMIALVVGRGISPLRVRVKSITFVTPKLYYYHVVVEDRAVRGREMAPIFVEESNLFLHRDECQKECRLAETLEP